MTKLITRSCPVAQMRQTLSTTKARSVSKCMSRTQNSLLSPQIQIHVTSNPTDLLNPGKPVIVHKRLFRLLNHTKVQLR